MEHFDLKVGTKLLCKVPPSYYFTKDTIYIIEKIGANGDLVIQDDNIKFGWSRSIIEGWLRDENGFSFRIANENNYEIEE